MVYSAGIFFSVMLVGSASTLTDRICQPMAQHNFFTSNNGEHRSVRRLSMFRRC